MARYEITVNHPNQVVEGYDDGTVTVLHGGDEFVLSFASDYFALDLVSNIAGARAAKHVAEQSAMETDHETRCADCGHIVGHAPGCLHVDLVRTKVRDLNVATRSVIRDAVSVPQSRGGMA